MRTLVVFPLVLLLLAGCDSLVGSGEQKEVDFDIVVFRVGDKLVQEGDGRIVVEQPLDYPAIEGRVYARLAISLEDYERMDERAECLVKQMEGASDEECPKDVQARLPNRFPFEGDFVSVNYELRDDGRTLRLIFEGTNEQLAALKQIEVVLFYYYYL